MRIAMFAATAICGLAICGCATITEGTSQEINVVTNPSGANCVFERQGISIGSVSSTPGILLVKKTKYDIMIKCNKPGFEEASYLNHSGVTATIAANVATDLLLTGGLSSVVDLADGADNKYDSAVNITLIPKTAMLPAATTVAATTPAP